MNTLLLAAMALGQVTIDTPALFPTSAWVQGRKDEPKFGLIWSTCELGDRISGLPIDPSVPIHHSLARSAKTVRVVMRLQPLLEGPADGGAGEVLLGESTTIVWAVPVDSRGHVLDTSSLHHLIYSPCKPPRDAPSYQEFLTSIPRSERTTWTDLLFDWVAYHRSQAGLSPMPDAYQVEFVVPHNKRDILELAGQLAVLADLDR